MSFVLWSVFIWGSISMYCLSYFYYTLDEGSTRPGADNIRDTSLNQTILIWVLPIQITGLMFLSTIGTVLYHRVNPKIILIICTLIMVACLTAVSYSSNWWQFLFLYGFGFPMSLGPSYFIPVMCAWEWFPEYKSTVTGCILYGLGFGPFIFGFISTAITNPNDVKPDVEGIYFPIEVANRFPHMIRICMACWTTILVIAICLIRRNPDFEGQG